MARDARVSLRLRRLGSLIPARPTYKPPAGHWFTASSRSIPVVVPRRDVTCQSPVADVGWPVRDVT